MISNIESDTNNHNNMSTAENSKTKPKQQSPLSEGNTSNNCKKYDEGQIADIDTTENTLSNRFLIVYRCLNTVNLILYRFNHVY